MIEKEARALKPGTIVELRLRCRVVSLSVTGGPVAVFIEPATQLGCGYGAAFWAAPEDLEEPLGESPTGRTQVR